MVTTTTKQIPFPGSSSTGARQGGNITYVLLGALAASGGLAVVADRNMRSANEQALEGASEVARESNISALNMMKVLLAMPVPNPSARKAAHVPAIFPDVYVNLASPYGVKIGSTANALPATAQGIWRFSAASGEVQVSSPDLRFVTPAAGTSGVFSAQHYSSAPSGPGSVQTVVKSVRPVYSGALISAYDVAVESTVAISARDASKGSRKVTTNARIAVDPPPVPECDMEVNQLGPVVPNTQVGATLRSHGVAFSARAQTPQTNGSLAWSAVALPDTAKSIRSSLQGGVAVKTWSVPAQLTEPLNSREGIMRLTGEVTGPGTGTSACSAAVKVYIRPTCSITANPSHLPDDGTTVLKVRATGAVDSMTVIGRNFTGASALSQDVAWSPAASGTLTATATVSGPAGMSGQCSVTITKEAPKCRFAKGVKERTAIGMTVPVFDGGYHQRESNWVTAGSGCTNTYFEDGQWKRYVFNDRQCPPCPAGDLCGRYNPHWPANPHLEAQFWRIRNYQGGDDCKFELGFLRASNTGCFDAETELTLADGTRKAISRLKQSDILLNPVTGEARKIKKIIRGPERSPMIELLVGSRRLVVTEDHPFHTGYGYFPAIRMREGDQVVSSGGKRVRVNAVRYLPAIKGPLEMNRVNVPDSDLPVVWNVELENVSTNPDDYMVEANGVAAGDLWLQMKLKNPREEPKT